MARQRILGVVLAGGAGRRLGPLTADRAKSAVPFGAIYQSLRTTACNQRGETVIDGNAVLKKVGMPGVARVGCGRWA